MAAAAERNPFGTPASSSEIMTRPPATPLASHGMAKHNPEPAVRNPFGTPTGSVVVAPKPPVPPTPTPEPSARNPFGTSDEQWVNILREKNEGDRGIWTDAHCSYCDHIENYKRMRSEKFWLSYNETMNDGQDDKFLWVRECWECVGKRLGIATEAESRKYIITNSRDYTSKKAKIDAFNTAKRVQKAFFPLLKSRTGYRAQPRRRTWYRSSLHWPSLSSSRPSSWRRSPKRCPKPIGF
jgi:hypothetical protein